MHEVHRRHQGRVHVAHEKVEDQIGRPIQEQQTVVAHKPRVDEQRDAEGADPTIEVQWQIDRAQQR